MGTRQTERTVETVVLVCQTTTQGQVSTIQVAAADTAQERREREHTAVGLVAHQVEQPIQVAAAEVAQALVVLVV